MDRPAVVALLTAVTMVAFAANSLLCRMALGRELIDPVSFTTIRLGSGALALLALARGTGSRPAVRRGSWSSALALLAYAAGFSLAYVTLSTGMGALILFGAVQATMLGYALAGGERLDAARWAGFLAAIVGLVYLAWPGVSAPDPVGALLMGGAGVGWGIYSVRGRGSEAPVAMTAGNFARAAPIAVAASLATLPIARISGTGVFLALVSGVVTSGLGYALWYRTLRGLSTTRASIVQLTVPALAAGGGVLVLGEALSGRLLVASALILGGVALAVTRGDRHGVQPVESRFPSP